MELKELINQITDSENQKMFYSDDPNNYIILDDYISDLNNFIDKRAISNEIKKNIEILIEYLNKVSENTDIKEIYNEGKSIYLNKDGNKVNPQKYFKDYILDSIEWKKAIEIGKHIEALS